MVKSGGAPWSCPTPRPFGTSAGIQADSWCRKGGASCVAHSPDTIVRRTLLKWWARRELHSYGLLPWFLRPVRLLFRHAPEMAAQVGVAPTPVRLTSGRTTVIRLSILNWSEWQDFRLRPPGPKPGALKTELHSEKTGGPEVSRTLNPPADNGALC
jgi:hypothetical protein